MPTGVLRGVARPTQALLKRLGRTPREASNVLAAMNGLEAVDALSRLLTEGIEKCTAADGRLDTKDLAAHVLAEMKRHSR